MANSYAAMLSDRGAELFTCGDAGATASTATTDEVSGELSVSAITQAALILPLLMTVLYIMAWLSHDNM